MKAIGVFPKDRSVRVVDAPEPALAGPTSVKLRMLEVGICGTDKEIMQFEYGDPPAGSDHLVLGHESLAEVVEAGPGVSSLKPGDLAVIMVRRPCQHPGCAACRAGRQDFCYTGDFTERGIKQRDGFMAQYVVDEERYVVPVPKELRDIGVLTEPLTIAEKAFRQIVEVQQRLPWLSPSEGGKPPLTGRKGLVLGAGPVGILGAMKLVASGCDTTVYSREPAGDLKARLVESLGAKYVSAADTPVDALDTTLGNIDLVYEATGAAKLSFDVLLEIGANAVFVFTGVPGRKYPVEIETGTLMRNMVLKNQLLLGTVNADRTAFEDAIRDLQLFRVRFREAARQVITRRLPVEDFPKTDWSQAGGIKAVVQF